MMDDDGPLKYKYVGMFDDDDEDLDANVLSCLSISVLAFIFELVLIAIYDLSVSRTQRRV
jgi:hypothetical protein